MRHGRFITLEGGEGSGKSTQAALLGQALEAAGIEVIPTREPGGTAGAEEIRKLILEGDTHKWDAVTELLLFSAARRDHVERYMKPALTAGKWVICDRFTDSSHAYQGFAHGLGSAYFEQLKRLTIGNFQPDLTLILDLPAEEGLKRAEARKEGANRFEEKERHFHDAVRRGFLAIAESEPERCAVVNAGKKPDVVHEQIVTICNARLGLSLQSIGTGHG